MKPEDAGKIWNEKSTASRPLVHQPNAQRYPSFHDYCFQYNRFGHKAAKCRSMKEHKTQCFDCKKFGHKASYSRNYVVVIFIAIVIYATIMDIKLIGADLEYIQ